MKSIQLDGPELERLTLRCCKALATIEGLDLQRSLRKFEASSLAVDLDRYLTYEWPSSMQNVGLLKKIETWNDEAERLLRLRRLW